ncbi:hypothetical protein Bca4012_013150 [Brassica carinata]
MDLFLNSEIYSSAGWICRGEYRVYKGAAQAVGRKIILENDCKKAMDILNGKALHFGLHNWIREIKWWTHCCDEIRF